MTTLIVGLGNPGALYQFTRHNVGFMAIDSIARTYCFSNFLSKFSSQISGGSIANQKILLSKPETYMNLSGSAVQKIKNYYKLELNNIIVIHDEIDLALGKVKIKVGGGSAGHNGIKSIDNHIGKDYLRIRIGIGRPTGNEDVSDYVLGKFSKTELQTIDNIVNQVSANIEYLLLGMQDKFIQQFSI